MSTLDRVYFAIYNRNMKTIKKIAAFFIAAVCISSVFAYNKKDLQRAVSNNNQKEVKKILSSTDNLTALNYDNSKNTILMLALKNNCDEKIIDMLLDAGCLPDIKNAMGQTPVMLACQNNYPVSVVKKLVNFGTIFASAKAKRVTTKDNDNKTAFDYAAGNKEVYDYLWTVAPDPAKPELAENLSKDDKQKLKEQEKLAKEEQKKQEKLAKEEAKKLKEEQKKQEKLAKEQAKNEPSEEIELEDIETKAEVSDAKTVSEPEEISPLVPVPEPVLTPELTVSGIAVAAVAASSKNEEQENQEKETTASSDTKESESPKETASSIETTETIPLVIPPVIIQSESQIISETEKEDSSKGIDLHVLDSTEQKNQAMQSVVTSDVTVPKIDFYSTRRKEYLFDEIENDSKDILEELRESKVTVVKNPDTIDSYGRTKLMNAIITDDIKLAYNLLYSGANPESQDYDGWTPMMYAAKYSKSIDMIMLLFEYGASLDAKNKFGISVTQVAGAYTENPEVLNIILNYAVEEKIDITDSFITALKSEREESIIRQYLKASVKINALYQGKTPLMYCAENYESTDVLKLLLQNGANPYVISSEGKNAFSYAKENSKINHDDIYWSLNVSSVKKR